MRISASITRVPYCEYTAGQQPNTVHELCYRTWQLLEFYPMDCIRRALDELNPTVIIRSRAEEDVPTLSLKDLQWVEERAGGLDLSGIMPEGARLSNEEICVGELVLQGVTPQTYSRKP